MDAATQQLLEKTKQRRAEIQMKLRGEGTPSAKSREPLTEHTNVPSSGGRSSRFAELAVHADTPAIKSVRSRVQVTAGQQNKTPEPVSTVAPSDQEYITCDDKSPKNIQGSGERKLRSSSAGRSSGSRRSGSGSRKRPSRGREGSIGASPSPKPANRKGRLAQLAAKINTWEDDPTHIVRAKAPSPPRPVWKRPAPPVVVPITSSGKGPAPQPPATANVGPAKPPRAGGSGQNRRRSRSANPSGGVSPFTPGGGTLRSSSSNLNSPANKGSTTPSASSSTSGSLSRTRSQSRVTDRAPNQSSGAAASAAPGSNKRTGKPKGPDMDQAWQAAPMNLRKNAWEQKIAEQKKIGEEHNRIMYGDGRPGGSVTKGATTQRQAALEMLQKGQSRENNPAAKMKQEREAELKALSQRHKNGLLKAGPESTGGQKESTEGQEEEEFAEPPRKRRSGTAIKKDEQATEETKQDFEKRLRGDGFEVTSSVDIASGQKTRVAKVSFKDEVKPAIDTNRASRTPGSSQGQGVQRKPSYKIPQMSYDSDLSSDEESGGEVAEVRKALSQRKATPGRPTVVPRRTTIPKMGYDSSMDDEEDHEASSSSSSEGESYCMDDDQDLDAALDEAMDTCEDSDATGATMATESERSALQRPCKIAPEEGDTDTYEAPVISVDAYRSMKQKSTTKTTTFPPIVRRPPSHNYNESSAASASPVWDRRHTTPAVDTNSVANRIQELQDRVSVETTQMLQARKALQEVARELAHKVIYQQTFLVASQRRRAFTEEIERLRSLGSSGHDDIGLQNPPKGRASLEIRGVELPLKRDWNSEEVWGEGETVHYFVIIMRSGPALLSCDAVSSQEVRGCGSISFKKPIILKEIRNDFRYDLEVYHMRVKLEPAGLVKKKKGSSKKSHHQSEQSGPGVESMTEFTQVSSIQFTLATADSTVFVMPKIPRLCPLQGNVFVKQHCTREANDVIQKDFLNMFEEVGGFSAWHRRWCCLRNSRLAYWKYPTDEETRDPIGIIDLSLCTSQTIGPVSRTKCAKSNTLEVVTRGQRERTEQTHWLSADSKEARELWCHKLNEALTEWRSWNVQQPRGGGGPASAPQPSAAPRETPRSSALRHQGERSRATASPRAAERSSGKTPREQVQPKARARSNGRGGAGERARSAGRGPERGIDGVERRSPAARRRGTPRQTHI